MADDRVESGELKVRAEAGAAGSDSTDCPEAKTAQGSDRRGSPRRSGGGVPTPYGKVADLSETGACLYRKGPCRLKTGQLTTLQIREPGMELDLAARVVRMRQVGLRRQEVGLEFVNVSARQRVKLRMLMAAAMPEFSPAAWLAA